MGIVFIDGRAAIGGRHRTAADGDRAVCAVAKDGLAIRAGGRHRAALHRDRTAAGDGSAVQAARRHRAACDLDFSTVETTFVDDLGADSLDVFQIIMGLEEEFDIEIPNEEAEKIVTVGDAVEQIKSALN